jgi:hypothetical protein
LPTPVKLLTFAVADSHVREWARPLEDQVGVRVPGEVGIRAELDDPESPGRNEEKAGKDHKDEEEDEEAGRWK